LAHAVKESSVVLPRDVDAEFAISDSQPFPASVGVRLREGIRYDSPNLREGRFWEVVADYACAI